MVLQGIVDLRRTLACDLKESEVRIKVDPDGTTWLFLGTETTGSDAAENINPSACRPQQRSRSNRDWCAFFNLQAQQSQQ